MGHKAPRTHYYAKGDKTTKCGRPPTMPVPMSDDMSKVTCGHCITPNRPFTLSPRDR